MQLPRDAFALSPIKSEEEWRVIEVFKKRAAEFISIRDKHSPGIVQANMTRLSDQRFIGNSNIPSDDKLKEIYLAFRFFYLEGEASNFLRVRSVLARYSASTEEVVKYLGSLKDSWNRALSQNYSSEFLGREISGKEYIDMWFNAHYFHSDHEKERKLEEVNAFLSEAISRFHLYLTTLSAGACVGLLYLAIKDLTRSNLVITIPRFYAGKSE